MQDLDQIAQLLSYFLFGVDGLCNLCANDLAELLSKAVNSDFDCAHGHAEFGGRVSLRELFSVAHQPWLKDFELFCFSGSFERVL